MRQDIYGGLRNACAHGSTLDQAIKSFIAAGYAEAEVREAARYIEQGVLPLTQPPQKIPSNVPPQTQTQAFPQNQTRALTQPMQTKPLQQFSQPQPQQPVQARPFVQPLQSQPMQRYGQPVQMQQQGSFDIRVSRRIDPIILVLSIILGLSVIAFICSLLFKEQIAAFLAGS